MFSKLNLKDYNNQLEEILEQKKFDEDVKNLLLSMFYKIENAYNDYSTVKIEVESKNDFIENLLRIIKEECNILRIVTPMTAESMSLEEAGVTYIIDESQKSILVYANEKDLLYALFKMDRILVCNGSMEEDPMCKTIDNLLNIGNSINCSEVIRDFNGWSWDITVKEIESLEYNLVYQDILLLFGHDFMKQLTNEEDETIREINIENTYGEGISKTRDYHFLANRFMKVYMKERIEGFAKRIYQMSIILESNTNFKFKQEMIQHANQIKNELNKMENRTEFLEEITARKKELNNQIGKIDVILHDQELLREEYQERNAKLANKDKIFSMSHLSDRMEKERQELLDEMKEYNRMIDPKEFLKKREEITNNLKFFEELSLNPEGITNSEKILKALQLEFLNCYMVLIDHAESKQKLMELFYKLRYYLLLPYKADRTIMDVPLLQPQIRNVMKHLIDRCVEKEVIENVSNSLELSYDILKYIFTSKLINLETIAIEIKKIVIKEEVKIEEQKQTEEINENEQEEKAEDPRYPIKITLYDTNVVEETHEDKVKNLNLLAIKLGKRVSLFK